MDEANSQRQWEDRGWSVPNPAHCEPLTEYEVRTIHRTYKCYIMFKPFSSKRKEFWLGPYYGSPTEKTSIIDDAEAIGPFRTMAEIEKSEQVLLHLVNLRMNAYEDDEEEQLNA